MDLLLFCLLFHLHFDLTTATSYTGGTNFINGANTNNEYTYDTNGNLTKDSNKGIANITYNLLSLPQVVTFSDGSTITYTYTHDGKKLRTMHVIGSVTTTTDYFFSISGKQTHKNKGLLGYITTPNGSFLMHDPTSDEVSQISTEMPSDPNGPGRLNNIAPTNNIDGSSMISEITDFIKNLFSSLL